MFLYSRRYPYARPKNNNLKMKFISFTLLFYLCITSGVISLLPRTFSFSNLQNAIKNETNGENGGGGGDEQQKSTTNATISTDHHKNGAAALPFSTQKPPLVKNAGTLPPKKRQTSTTEAGQQQQKGQNLAENKSAISQALLAGGSTSKKKDVKNDEASILPFYRLKHSKSMPSLTSRDEATYTPEIYPNKNQIAKKFNVIADGNCLFRSFAVSLYGHDDGIEHKVLRQSAVKTLIKFELDTDRWGEADQEKMKLMIIANLPIGKEMSNYKDSIALYAINYVAKNAAFVGTAECQALAIYLNRTVALINSRLNSVTVFHADLTQTEHVNITRNKYKQLWELEDNPIVIWHDGGLHFNSIRLVSSDGGGLKRSMSQKITKPLVSLLDCFSTVDFAHMDAKNNADFADKNDTDDDDDDDDDNDNDCYFNILFKTPPSSPSMANHRQLSQRSSFKLPSKYNPFFIPRRIGGGTFYDVMKDEEEEWLSKKIPLIDLGKYQDFEQKTGDEKGNAKRTNPFLKPDGSSYKENDA